jgi:GH24 family phage-related lysozyme (muramidase)
MVTLTRHVNTPSNYDLELPGRGTLQNKLYVGFVKIADDVLKMGRLKVWIPELSGDPNDENGWFIVNYCAPFAGATNVYDNKNENTYAGTQKSYGMWFVPPDVNNEVVCAFISGDPARGIWLGCLYQQNMNHMIPGLPGQDTTASEPVAEYNKRVVNTNINAPVRPRYDPLADGLVRQGLQEDVIRGVSDSGARRADPVNSVYGILTPGGNQFVFDDSPSNSYIRLRTQHGAQIMINDSAGFIYLNSVDGRNWISMDATGKIDIYAQDDISIRSQGSLNLRGDIDVNIEAGRDINMRARGRQVGAGVSTNPVSEPPPSIVPPGNITVLGDSIALGVGQRIDGAVVSAEVGDTSSKIVERLQNDDNLRNGVNAIISAGTNDIVSGQGNTALLTENLGKIRAALSASKYIWLLPYDSVAKTTVKAFADSNGDTTLDLSRFPTVDNIHPRDYALVANEAKSLCIPDPNVVPTAVTNPGAAQAPGSTTGYYRTLQDAEAGAASYRSAADFARENPQMYSDDERRAVFRLEAAANAEVQRLRGEGATTPATIQDSQPPVTQVAARAPQPTTPAQAQTQAEQAQDWRTIVIPFLRREEGFRERAYRDPPNTNFYAVGYGHNMGKNEIPAGRTVINAGAAGTVPIRGPNGSETVVTREQAEGILLIDLENIAARPTQRILGGAWDILGPYQKAALVSFAYNAGGGGIRRLVAKGLTNFINQRDIESAAKLIETTITRVGNYSLESRRRAEANLYRERPELAGQGGNAQVVDGYPVTSNFSVTAQGAPLSPVDTNVQGGFVRIQSRNSMHLLSGQHMFISTSQDMHRLAGNNIFDSAVKNVDRAAGGYMHESARDDWTVSSGRYVNINAPKVDINGPTPPTAIAAAQAVGPISQRQTDAVVNSLGNVIAVLTDTILPHLPFHEPYDNHGGRHFENIRDATALNTQTGLRDGEIVPNSSQPLDIYGTPRSEMPQAIYRGVDYNTRGQPLYRYEAPMSNIVLLEAGSLSLDADGRQFIVSRENGSYRPITVGNPPKQEIGYGHSLTPEELSQRRLTIGGLSVPLDQPLTQQQINDLFDQDVEAVQRWMRPEIKQPLSQTQYDMFCSLAFNIGENNFKSSPALKAFNDGDLQKVPNSWMQHTRNAAGNVVPGLVIRRRAEVVKFMQGPATDDIGGGSNTAITSGQLAT